MILVVKSSFKEIRPDMKTFLLFIFIPATLFAEVITDCGQYTAKGVVRAYEDGVKLIVNEKTQSEYIISMPKLEQGKIVGHIDRDVTVKLVLDKSFNGHKGVTENIISIESRIPDPLKPGDTGFTLDKKTKCKKN